MPHRVFKAAVTVAALLALLAGRVEAQAPGSRILVVPFDNTQHEPRLHWISEASAVLLADRLNARGLVAISRAERSRAFEQLHLPPAASLSRATLIKVGQMVGASDVMVGSFSLQGNDLAVSAHAVRIDAGRVQPGVSESAPLTGLFALFDRLAARLATLSGPGGRAVPAQTPGQEIIPAPALPLDAFESYIKGLIAESPAVQATFLESAIRLHPPLDAAKLALWEVRTEQDDHAAALSAARLVVSGSPHERTARFLAAVSLLELKRLDEAFDGFSALDPGSAAAGTTGAGGDAAIFNNLGVVQIRRGSTPQAGSAAFYLTKAADADSGDADYLFNLGYAYLLERNTTGAQYWLREALRRNPADADAHYVLAAALLASGSSVEAAREKELARQLSSRYEELESRAAADKLPVPRGLERIRADLEPTHGLRPEQAIVNSAQREQRELSVFHLDRGRRLYEREEDREAMAELRRAVYLSPYEAQAHLLIGRIHVRASRLREGIDALKISVWSEDSAAARIALAEAYLKVKNPAAARGELERALVLDPASAAARKLLSEIK